MAGFWNLENKLDLLPINTLGQNPHFHRRSAFTTLQPDQLALGYS